MAIEMVPVTSKNMSHVGYDAETNELHVKFHSGPTYIHSNVDPDQYALLMADSAPGKSVGQHYNVKFRGNEKHPHRIIPGVAPPR